MTDHLIVVCQNDYPSCVLPAGTTHDQASTFCKLRKDKYQEDQQRHHGANYSSNAVYFHWHEVPVERVG